MFATLECSKPFHQDVAVVAQTVCAVFAAASRFMELGVRRGLWVCGGMGPQAQASCITVKAFTRTPLSP